MSPQAAFPDSGFHVLLVDDEAVIAELFAESLLADGHDVAVASNGEDALALFEAAAASGHPYDVLVTDIMMPRMDGVTLARRLRAGYPKLPIVVVSGYAPAEQLHRLGEGASAPVTILAKPVRLARLCSAIRSAVGH